MLKYLFKILFDIMMDYMYNFSEEDEEFYQQETVEESFQENYKEHKFKKLIDPDSEISNISSICRLENESLKDKREEKYNESKNEVKSGEYKNGQDEKSQIEYEEEYIELDDQLSQKEEKVKNEKENVSEDNNEVSNNIQKYHIFTWNEGGNEVKITGTFSNWKDQFQMIKDPKDNIFKFQLPLKNEIYQYKFIVDGQWKFSKNFPFKDDGNGNINNILDNTKINLIQPKNAKNEENNSKNKISKKNSKKKNKKNKQRKLSTKTKTTKTRTSSINKDKITRKNSIYQSQYPSDDDITPLPLPNKRYFESFQLENYSNQKFIGNDKYYLYHNRYCFSFEASSKPIFLLGHINLNHLISVNNNNSIISKNSMSFRYREKASTFIYYKKK